MSIAYLLGKGSSKPLHYQPNIPLLLVLSIIPDIDIFFDLLTGSQLHRGPTHSVIVAIIASIPFFIIYRKKAIPYFLALISHPLIGDFFIGGKLELLWPFSNAQFGLHELGGPYISIYMPIDGLIEVSLFIVAIVVLVKSNDWKVFFTAHKSNLLLIIPLLTVLLPSTIGYPFSESLFLFSPILAVAHVILVVLFSIAVLKTLQSMYPNRKVRRKPGLVVKRSKEDFPGTLV
jgi:hypothetical protein